MPLHQAQYLNGGVDVGFSHDEEHFGKDGDDICCCYVDRSKLDYRHKGDCSLAYNIRLMIEAPYKVVKAS